MEGIQMSIDKQIIKAEKRSLKNKSDKKILIEKKCVEERIESIISSANLKTDTQQVLSQYKSEIDNVKKLTDELNEVAINTKKYTLEWAFHNADEKLSDYLVEWNDIISDDIDISGNNEEEEEMAFSSYLEALCFDSDKEMDERFDNYKKNDEDREEFSSYMDSLGCDVPKNKTYTDVNSGIKNNSKLKELLKHSRRIEKISGKFFKFLSLIITIIEIVFSMALVITISELSHSAEFLISSQIQGIIFVLSFTFLKVWLEIYLVRPRVEKFGWKLYNRVVEKDTNYFIAMLSLTIIVKEKFKKADDGQENIFTDEKINSILNPILNAL